MARHTRQAHFTTVFAMLAFLFFALGVTPISGQGVPAGGSNGAGADGNSGQQTQQASDPKAAIAQYQYFINGDALPQRRSMLIAHAVMACLVWALLIPLGGMLLRMNLNSPWVIKAHIVLQTVSFCLYIAAVGLGIFLINSLGSFSSLAWEDAHPRLGLAILAMASIQPFLGYLHHRVFKQRMAAMHQSGEQKRPGSTIWGQSHVWLGRLLMILGMINGGLGLRLADKSPAWLMPAPMPARTAYAVSVSVSTLAYVVVIVIFERRRRRGARRTLALDGGQESPQVEEQKIVTGTGREPK